MNSYSAKGAILPSFLILSFLALFLACSTSPTTSANSSKVFENDGKTLIVDRRGTAWDITHAVAKYGMNPDYFNFGIGKNAISSIDDPKIVHQGEQGYPTSGSDFSVFGVSLEKEDRAYSEAFLSRHEIVNETFGEAHVSVAY